MKHLEMTHQNPIPENETLRLQKLEHYKIMDTEAEEMFDNLTTLAAMILEVPICLISLIDETRQWFKSKVGIEIAETPREISFCQHAIMGEHIFEVKNALDDHRFKTNPLVTSDLSIRFYAGAPLTDSDGASIGTLCAIDTVPKELTQEKRKALDLISKAVMQLIVLRRDKMEVEKLSMAKDEFLSNMSHEIRTPLNAIIGFNDLLGKSPLNRSQQEYVDIIRVSSQNLKVIVNDILDVAKLESGAVVLEEKAVSLREIVDYVIKLQGPIAKEKGIKLISSIDHEVPDFVLGDETRLSQIFLNLINNAIKFTDKGFVELKCVVNKFEFGKAHLFFSVKDTGIGIEEDKLSVIFERFSQAESSTTRLYGGTGLGLNIVKRIVGLYSGHVQVKSNRNSGSEFSFEINLQVVQQPAPKAKHKAEKSSVEQSLAGVQILLVEDNVHNQILAKTYLNRLGADITLAQNGEIAIRLISKCPYDLILMDLQMPVMDGFETTKLIREKLQLTVPIIGCSAHSLAGERKKCLQLGMNDYIAKPYSETELVETVLHYCRPEAIQPNESTPELSELIFDDFNTLLDHLREKEGQEFVEVVTGHFIERTPKDIQDIQTALETKNLKVLVQKSHLVAGSLGVFGFQNGFELSRSTEQSAKEGNMEQAEQLANQLVSYLHKALTSLN